MKQETAVARGAAHTVQSVCRRAAHAVSHDGDRTAAGAGGALFAAAGCAIIGEASQAQRSAPSPTTDSVGRGGTNDITTMPTSTQPTPSHACVLVVPPLLPGASIIRPGKQQSRRAGSPSTPRSLRVALARNTLCVVLVWVSMAGGCRQQPAARRMAGGSSLLLAALAKGPAAGGDGDIDWRGGVFQPCADVRQNLRTPLCACWQPFSCFAL